MNKLGISGKDTEYARMNDRYKALIFETVRAGRLSSRKRLAAGLHIRPTSVGMLVGEMLKDGLLLEVEPMSKGKQGRPEKGLEVNGNIFMVISIYIEVRDIVAALINLEGKIIATSRRSIPEDADNSVFMDACEGLIREVRACCPRRTRMLGISMSLAGSVDQERKRWDSCARWPNIREADLADLERKMSLPVQCRRRLDSALSYLMEADPEAAGRSYLLYHWGFGIGAAYARNGEVIGSRMGRFCEIGHTRLCRDSHRKCLCGSEGCIETEAAMWAILPELSGYTDKPVKTESDFAELLERPGICDLPVIDRATDAALTGLVNLCRIFYPDKIMLSGPFFNVPATRRKAMDILARSMSGYILGKTGIETVDSRCEGAILTGAMEMMQAELDKLLKARF